MISGDILVDVYSVAGTRVRGGVTASGATAGLAPGIYILRTGSSACKVAVR
ncbi:MAG: hypothetical protein K2L62_05750 [Muribaculaceae bacterium]|nr:hypothetical protein [Muribaculaceae bacterium]MDE6629352.1 hypothetical protein [Muribaculaceae bacterium]